MEWPPRDPASVAPLNKDGLPHMYAYMPSGFVYYDEAVARGWRYFYEGKACSHGHIAPRSVRNKSLCVDCDRIKSGRAPIGGMGEPQHAPKGRPRTSVRPETIVRPISTRVGATGSKSPQRPVEPTKRQKDFLAAYAELKDFDAAAKKVSVSPAVLESELSYSLVFRDAYDALEERIGVFHTVSYDTEYEWDDEKRAMLIRMYIDTGMLDVARDAIRITPSLLEEELKSNPTFAAQLIEAKPLADKIVDEKIRRAAIEGNPQILGTLSKRLSDAAPEDSGSGRTREQLIDELVRTLGLAKRDAANRAPVADTDAAIATSSAVEQADIPGSVEESMEDLL
jgi:hypothetical protein